jgi:hypothetical protein
MTTLTFYFRPTRAERPFFWLDPKEPSWSAAESMNTIEKQLKTDE